MIKYIKPVETINGVTRYEVQKNKEYRYLFPLATINAFPKNNPNKDYYTHKDLRSGYELTFFFKDIEDRLGANNVIEYVDALANIGHFFGVELAGKGNLSTLSNMVVVKDASQLVNIDSTKLYFADGFITLPDDIDLSNKGFTTESYGFNLGGFIKEGGHIFTGTDVKDIVFSKMTFRTDGQVFNTVHKKEISSATEELETAYAVEGKDANFEGCQGLGTITDARQFLEGGCGFFGCDATLIFENTLRTSESAFAGQPYAWNGIRSDTNIGRGLAGTTVKYKAGANFRMTGSMICNINIDLGTNGVLSDFAPINFTDNNGDFISNVLQFEGVRVFRNGTINTDYSSALPNISQDDITCDFGKNRGLGTTRKGGRIDVTTALVTTIVTPDTYVFLNGITTASKLSHTDSPGNFEIRNLDAEPNDFDITGFFIIQGTAGNEIEIGIYSYEDGGTNETLIDEFKATVDSIIGVNDTAKIYIDTDTTLQPLGYIDIKVRNKSSMMNVTANTGSFYKAKKR